MIDYKRIGERIRLLREHADITQEDLADWAHLSPVQISRIENGHKKITLETLVSIAAVFKMSLDELVYDESQSTSTGMFDELLRGCTEEERLFLLDMMIALKAGIRRLNPK